MDPLNDSGDDRDHTHFYGDGCDPPHIPPPDDEPDITDRIPWLRRTGDGWLIEDDN